MSLSPASSSPVFTAPRPGDVIAGKYQVDKTLGAGGMGLVVAATHIALKERVALKFLLPSAAELRRDAYDDATSKDLSEGKRRELETRFLREAQAAVRIKSEHVARVLDVGALESGSPYMVMELLEGTDLNKLSRKNGPLPVAVAADYLLQACEAIAEAHALGIVHRDLKPANLFLAEKPDGSSVLKVLDFGISKVLNPEPDDASLTSGSEVLGSPLYMAPEQIRNPKNVDPRADVWSLGSILYKLLAGRAAFEADSPSATLVMIISEEPTPLSKLRPDAPSELDEIIRRCLEKDISRRFQSVDELARALLPFAPAKPRRAWAEGDQTASGATLNKPIAQLTPASSKSEGSRRTVMIAAGLGSLLALGSVLAYAALSGSAPAAEPAQPAPSADLPASPSVTLPLPSAAPSSVPSVEVAPSAALPPTSASVSASAPPPPPPPPPPPTPRKVPQHHDALDDRL